VRIVAFRAALLCTHECTMATASRYEVAQRAGTGSARSCPCAVSSVARITTGAFVLFSPKCTMMPASVTASPRPSSMVVRPVVGVSVVAPARRTCAVTRHDGVGERARLDRRHLHAGVHVPCELGPGRDGVADQAQSAVWGAGRGHVIVEHVVHDRCGGGGGSRGRCWRG